MKYENTGIFYKRSERRLKFIGGADPESVLISAGHARSRKIEEGGGV